jgi:hypothetical protein
MTTQPAVAPRSVDDFFDGVGETGAPSFKFTGVNSGIKGTVVDQYATVVTEPGKNGQPGKVKTYADGQPIPQLNVTLQTALRDWKGVNKVPTDEDGNPLPAGEDTGLRRIYVKYQMRKAVGAAVKANPGCKGLATGGTLAVKQTGEQDTGQVNPLPIYEARYAPPVAEQHDEFWGDDSTPAQPTAQPAAQSAPVADDDEPPF